MPQPKRSRKPTQRDRNRNLKLTPFQARYFRSYAEMVRYFNDPKNKAPPHDQAIVGAISWLANLQHAKKIPEEVMKPLFAYVRKCNKDGTDPDRDVFKRLLGKYF